MVTARQRVEDLKRRRLNLGRAYTQKWLAKRLLVTAQSVSSWETGNGNPPHEFLLRAWEMVIREAEEEIRDVLQNDGGAS